MKKDEFTLNYGGKTHTFVFEVPPNLEKIFKGSDKPSAQWALVQILRQNEAAVLPLIAAEFKKGSENVGVICTFARVAKPAEFIVCQGEKGTAKLPFLVIDDYPRPVLAGDGMDRVRGRTRGFSLIEVVVVVAVMAILATGGYMAVRGAGSAAKAAQATSNARVLNTALETTFANGNATSTAGAVTYSTSGAVPTTLGFSIPLPTQIQIEAALSLLGVGNYTEVTSADVVTPAVVWAVASTSGPSVTFMAGTNAQFQSSGAPVGFAFSGNSVVVNSAVPLGGQRSFGIRAITATGASGAPTTAPTTAVSATTTAVTTTAPTTTTATTTTATTTTTSPTTPTTAPTVPTVAGGGGGLGDGPPTPTFAGGGGGGPTTPPPITPTPNPNPDCSGGGGSSGGCASGGGCDVASDPPACSGVCCVAVYANSVSYASCDDEQGNPLSCQTISTFCTTTSCF